jgi:hypothetical protein
MSITYAHVNSNEDLVFADLAACDAMAVALQEPGDVRAAKVATTLLGGLIAGAAWSGHDSKVSQELWDAYSGCMQPRGYDIYLWEPSPRQLRRSE